MDMECICPDQWLGDCMSDFNVTNDLLHSIVGHCIGLVLA